MLSEEILMTDGVIVTKAKFKRIPSRPSQNDLPQNFQSRYQSYQSMICAASVINILVRSVRQGEGE